MIHFNSIENLLLDGADDIKTMKNIADQINIFVLLIVDWGDIERECASYKNTVGWWSIILALIWFLLKNRLINVTIGIIAL